MVVVLLCAAGVVTQSRIVRPQPSNSNNSGKRQRVATLRASDSPDGSRVALTSDQSLNDYEAYRRGDRFYVKIPPADVPRAEIVRGRAFGDVKVNRSADSTVVSFRLQPGATARVEQRGNKLDVVFKMPGTSSSPARTNNRDVSRNDAGPSPPNDQRRKQASNSNTTAPINSQRTGANRNASDRALAKATPSPTPKPTPSPTAKPSPTAQTSPVVKSSPLIAQQRSSPTPANQSTVSQPAQATTWNKLKARARYMILLAQLNPLPVIIGIAVLLLLVGLFVLQRRRARATRRFRPPKETTKAPAVTAAKSKSPAETPVEVAKPIEVAAPVMGAAAAALVANASKPEETPDNGQRHERVARVSEEVKKIMAGGEYDESVIASEDRDTRQLVGAELLSALVGRNLQRRERARAAFMKHGYFDDATRDLRTAESPNERAAAARRLSFIHDREAAPHLIGGLDDPSPDVRRASVEALMDLRDPAAIGPLNSLMQTENDRKVPRTLIKHAIEACAIGAADPDNLASPATTPTPDVISQSAETEREVIEI